MGKTIQIIALFVSDNTKPNLVIAWVTYLSYTVYIKFVIQPHGRHYAMEKWARCAYRWLEGPCLAWEFTGIRHWSFEEIWCSKWLYLDSSNEINIVVAGPDYLRGYGEVKGFTHSHLIDLTWDHLVVSGNNKLDSSGRAWSSRKSHLFIRSIGIELWYVRQFIIWPYIH